MKIEIVTVKVTPMSTLTVVFYGTSEIIEYQEEATFWEEEVVTEYVCL